MEGGKPHSVMTSKKIAPNIIQQGPKSVLDREDLVAVGLEISGPSSATLPSRKLHKEVAELAHELCFGIAGPIVNSYKGLPWLTRKTISVSVALSSLLYIFITVPFRIAFYYSLHPGHDDKAHLWSRELTFFSVFDGMVDIVGLINFVAFYETWKSAFYELSKVSSVRSVKSRPSNTDRHSSVKTMVRQLSSAHLQLGRVNWTISSIKPLSSMPGDDANCFTSQHKYMMARNIEFLLEIIALIPLEGIPLVLDNYNLLHLVRTTKLCRLYRLRNCFVRVAKLYSDRDWVQHLCSTGVDSLVRTIGVCAGLCHWVACGYMFLGHAQCGLALDACDGSVETSWIIRDRLRGASVRRKYGRTLYWAARTLVLLGYDDVTPVSNVETLYGIIVNLLGALCGSSLLANFLFLFRFRNARYAAYSTHVDNAREYMRLQNIPRAVRQQVTAYFNYAWSTHHSLDSEDALQLLPQHLQSKVVATLRANRIAQVCFLMKESVEFINELALSLVRQVFSPGDQIIEPKVNAQMFFIIRGQVLISAINGAKPTECKTGDSFAEMCLLLPEFYLQRAIAKTFCELYVLTKAKFDDVLSEYHPGRETQVRHHMAEMLEKYKMQLRKTRKILGLQDGYENVSGKSSVGRFSAGRFSMNRSKSSHGRSSAVRSVASIGRLSMSRTTRALTPGQNSVHELRKQTNWRFPDSSFRLVWDSLRLVAVIYVAFEVPYFAVFTSMTEDQHMFVVDYGLDLRYVVTTIVEAFFALDLILRSRYFAFMDHNAMLAIVRPDLIFSTYKTDGFYLDVIAWFPVGIVLDALPTSNALVYSSCFRLLRMLRLRLIPKLLQDLADSYGASSKLRMVTALVLGVTLMLHIVGCLWFEMALFPSGDHSGREDSTLLISELTRSECLRHATLYHNCSWVKFDCYAHLGLHFPQEDPESWYQASFAYLRSVYWAMVTLTAVGYGDIVAYSTAESYFAAVWAFLGGIINFGVMGAMSSTISNMMATHHHHMEKLTTVNSIMERVNLSKRLSVEIRRFYHQQFVGRKQAYESQLLSHLPDELCYQISTLLHSKAVKSVQLFDSATIEFEREITGKFRHRSYQNGETICLEGDICREFFVFLQGSKINVFYRSRKVPIRALHADDCYGVNEFLLKKSHPATLIAASYVHASVMSREQFEVIQRKFADDLRDIRDEAHTYYVEDRASMKRIMTNLARIKLQPHLLQTPSLFYQRDNAFITDVDEKTTEHGYSTSQVFLTCWLAMIAFWNVYNAGFVIFRICFYTHLHFSSNENVAVWITDLSCDVCFAIDIYLRLYYFGHHDVGFENLVERKEMNKQYLRSSGFKWDLVASFPAYTPFPSGSLIASLCRLPRLVRCVELWSYLDDVIVQVQQHFASHNVSAFLGPVKLLVVLVLVAHYVGCIFFLISERECKYLDRCWMTHDPLLHGYHDNVPMLYAKTFYWAITTLLLVGSREIVPRGLAGTLWTGFTCLLCTFVIGHIVGEISELILGLGKETKQYKSRIAHFESFANEHELASDLRERIAYFFHVEFQQTKGIDMCKTMHDLSANLRLKFILELYGRSIEQLPISSFLTAVQINNLALRLQSELFIPGDNILVEGTFGSRLCTLRKGQAAAYWTKSITSVAVLMEGAFFGEIAFFLPNQRRLATVRATSSCEVLHISKHDWQELWVSSDDPSENNVQKHAQYAILGWVNSRLQRYQRSCLRTVRRAQMKVKPPVKSVSSSVRRASRFFTKGRAIPQGRRMSNGGHVLLWAPTPPRLMSKVEICRMFVPPTLQLLEKKAEYILSKSSACAQPFSETELRPNSRSGLQQNGETSRARGGSRTMFGKRVSSLPLTSTATKTDDLRHRQFIVDLNPINDYLSDSLGAEKIRELETESWARFKLLAALQHVVSRLLGDLIPSEAGMDPSPPIHIPVKPKKHKQLRPFRFDERAKRKWSAAIMQMVSSVSRRKTIGPEAAMLTATEVPKLKCNAKVAPVRRRSFPAVLSQDLIQAKPTGITSNQSALVRSRSLPFFDDDFFRDREHFKGSYRLSNDERKGGSGIDFEILQRCQSPQYASQLQWYQRYCRWKRNWKGIKMLQGFFAPEKSRLDQTLKNNQVSPQEQDIAIPGHLRHGDLRSEVVDIDPLRIPNQNVLRAAISDFESKDFIRHVKLVGKIWDFIMVLASVYYLLVTPFKICFSYEITHLSTGMLDSWSGFEIFLDVLCFMDLVYKLYHSSSKNDGTFIATTRSSLNTGIRQGFSFSTEFRGDIVAMLPLELLLFVVDVKLPTIQLSQSLENANALWWTSRWVLRINRMLFFRRIQPLTEELIQFAIHDLNLPLSEELLYFVREMATYITMGHLLACIWYLTSGIGLYYYGISWLSTPGMLQFASQGNPTVDVGDTHRFLQATASTSTITLGNVSLIRQYLRSLLFSMECISTLFNGDIISMNPVELIAEIVITFWSIYIYGALIGAQGEWIDSQARQEAAYEQNLAALQHFLTQNDVPKGLKRQVKAYFARMWRRHQGRPEFASVENVSRALYEDVVLATQRDFTSQVRVFRVLDDNFLRGLLVCLEYVVCSEGEEVVTKGDMDRSMYFIAQGQILVRMDCGEMMRERGEFFGEFALLYGISRLETCTALSVAELYRLDHEPYEKLLHDFPGYRRRNKQSWTTPVPINDSVLRTNNYSGNTTSAILGMAPILANRTSVRKLDAVRTQSIENELAHSYVYKSTMEMLAQLQTMHPEEAKSPGWFSQETKQRNAGRLSTDQQGPQDLLIPDESSIRGPTLSSLPEKPETARRIIARRLLRPLLETYQRLPWTTRHTISVGSHLYVVLYVFFTVPFRIAFYYNPYHEKANQWTEALSIFVFTDGIADLLGFFQFLSFFRHWRKTFEQVKSSLTSEKSNQPNTVEGNTTNKLARAHSFHIQGGITKWTIATIESLSTMTNGAAEKFMSLRKDFHQRNVQLILELVALVPVEVIPIAVGTFNVLHLVRVTKLCRLYKLKHCLTRIAKIYSDRSWMQHLSSTGVDTLVQTIGLCAASIHWAACGYMLIAHLECGVAFELCDDHFETNWVIRDRLHGASVGRKYGRTLYWASRTLVLLGYDDVTPVSSFETLYVILVILMGALFGSSLLANFLFLFRFRNARYAAFSAHVDNAREYMRLRNIPRSVRHQVTAYFNYAWNTHHSLNSEEALALMPKHLQAKVVSTLKASRIKQVCFLTKETVEFTNRLAIALIRRIYSPGDHIIEPKANAEMFFVIRGTVVVVSSDESKPNECKAGDFFADSCLLFPEQFDQQARAKTFCELYVLAKSRFDAALTEFYQCNEAEARARMGDTFEKYSMQLSKMKKMLGLRGATGNTSKRTSVGGSSHSVLTDDLTFDSRRGLPWQLPGSSFSARWNLIRLVGIIYVAFEAPYFAVFISMSGGSQIFTAQPEVGLRYMVTLLVEVIFGVDFILRSRYFAYLEPTVMINVAHPSLIFSAYKKNGMYLDFLAWVPVGLVLESLPITSIHGYSSLFRLARLLRLRWIPHLLQNLSDYYGTSSKMRLVASLILGVSLMLHIIGCIWFQMTHFSEESAATTSLSTVMVGMTRSECLEQATRYQNCTWVKFDCYSHIGSVFPSENPDSMYQASFAYLRSVYWAVVTLTAVGYGDIVAYSTAESYFAALWVFLGGIINFGVVGAMSSTISNMLATHHHHMEKLNTLNIALERMEISEKLSTEIRRFYHQQFSGRKKAYESKLLSHLPNQLCYEISSLLHSDAVKSVSLFDSASIEFLKAVTGKFRHRSFQNGETICFEGDVCRDFFVFLPGSKVNLLFRSRKVPVRALHGGDCYGVSEFLLRKPYTASLVAASHVHASVMTRDQFDNIQRKFSDDVNDMKEEAEVLSSHELLLLSRVSANLEKMKLQPHSMQTPTLFYQRESAILPNKMRQTNWRTGGGQRILKATWKTMIAFWNLYNATFVIFRICFHSHLHLSSRVSGAILLMDLSCDICFALDIYLRLYDNPDGSLERKKLNKQYLRSSTLKWDLLASLPLYSPFSSGSLIASSFRLPRLIRCVDLWHYLDDVTVHIQQQFATHNVSAYLSPAKLMIILVVVAHYVGCIFFWISEHECKHVDNCWIAHDHMVHEYHHAVLVLYGKSFYWALTTLLLVGSRESVPRDTLGTLWTGFTCLCCTFIIGHIVGEISELILELGKEEKQYKNCILNFENFAKSHDLPPTLRERVGFFFREEFKHTKGSDLRGCTRDLSANLRLKLMLEIYGHAIANLPICRFLTSSQVNNLALRFQSELFIPGDNILVEGMYGSRLCTLRKGLAAAYWTKSVSSIAILMEGAFFGEIAFFLPNQRRLATVRATTFCEVLFISKNDWQELWTTSNNASDNQIQKHAMHAVLGWVSSRLQRYQRASLRIAGRCKRFLGPNTVNEDLSATDDTKRNGLESAKIKSKWLSRIATPPRKPSKTDLRKLFTSPEAKLLEKKAEYLLAKTDACSKMYSSEIEMLQMHKSSLLASIRSSIGSIQSSLRTTNQSRGTANSAGLWQSGNADVSILLSGRAKNADIRLLQFMVDLNPINKHVRESIGSIGIYAMEQECWARFRLLAEAQHATSKLLETLLPSELSPDQHTAYTKAQAQNAPVSSKPESGATWRGITRCHSLPAVTSEYFDDKSRGWIITNSKKGGSGIDFDILQHSQRPQYQAQIHWYHRYRQWRGSIQATVVPLGFSSKPTQPRKTRDHTFSLTGDLVGVRRIGRPRVAAMGSMLQLPSQRTLFSATTDIQSKEFIQRVKNLGKLWDLVILFVAIYHLLVTPFKVSFSRALVELPLTHLYNWSAIEVALDVICVVDVIHQLRRAWEMQQNVISFANTLKNPLQRALDSNPELKIYLLAMIPLEICLLATDVRLPMSNSLHSSVDASWWITRWVLRMNRMLLIGRIEPLTEQLFQYLIDDLKMPVSDSLLYFARGLASYLATGHILACIWFFSSEIGFNYYGTSWLSTSGMLTYISSGTEVAEHTARMLSENSSTFYLASVSLGRKYLRSLLFSLECISTLFYGDILSMNPLELIAEIVITLWSIYIYGALVGAQAELLDSRARREAAFEQSLGELQHYIVQNGVQQPLKRHIKTYYARLWRRCRGEHEFAVISNVSRALYEDVVLTTLRNFVAQVRAFRGLDEHFLRALLVCLEYVVCSENEEIFVVGDVDRSMYFIAQGRIIVKTGTGDYTRERGEYFGELTLLYGISRLETCVAVTVAELYRLDHESYERLLREYPEYRTRNKLSWTTFADADRTGSQTPQRPLHSSLALRPSMAKVAGTNAQNIESRLQFSFVHTAAMKMLARVHALHPLEAKEFILKSRDGARKHLMRNVITEDACDSAQANERLHIFEKSRALRIK
ncbi:Cyclic nucleotide-gated cation channel [Phytophthora citrophthora]|uniref:Cyclic nucleotide-gated cation channel n=1 Tax=Phytophthora citrophthora TaxID=4793 RepID=A0AAD9GRF1_9STRA|nr:Cyclic nucleotide-gated cation channel [Phytophthora citrophthora]